MTKMILPYIFSYSSKYFIFRVMIHSVNCYEVKLWNNVILYHVSLIVLEPCVEITKLSLMN